MVQKMKKVVVPTSEVVLKTIFLRSWS